MLVKSNVETFVGKANLENRTALDLVITSLKGTTLKGMWNKDTDLFLLTVLQNRRSCIWRQTEFPYPDQFIEEMNLPRSDAECLDKWLKDNFPK